MRPVRLDGITAFSSFHSLVSCAIIVRMVRPHGAYFCTIVGLARQGPHSVHVGACRYTGYELDVGIAGGQRFSLSKRYREFLELHHNLAGFYPHLSLPSVASVSPCSLHCLSGTRGPLNEEPPHLQHREHAICAAVLVPVALPASLAYSTTTPPARPACASLHSG